MKENKINKVEVIFVEKVKQQSNNNGKLMLSNEGIFFENHSFLVSDISEIELSMCSMASSIRAQVLYYIDLNICIDNKKYFFQVMNTPVILDVIGWIKRNHIKYTDKLGIEYIFTQYTDELERWKFINRNFHKWAKKYHLDNPRDNYYKNYYEEMVTVIGDTIKNYKEMK